MLNPFKKRNVAFLFASLLALSTLFAPLSAFAATADTRTTTATIQFTGGSLVFDSAPNLDFGTNVIPIVQTTYNAAVMPTALQITDARGTAVGWKVTVALDTFMDGAVATLAGSTISFSNGVGAAVNNSVGTVPAIATPTVTSGGAAAQIFTAANNSGAGTWKINWAITDIGLTVFPGTALVGTSTANLYWTLVDAP